MTHFVGLDVAQKLTSVCVIDNASRDHEEGLHLEPAGNIDARFARSEEWLRRLVAGDLLARDKNRPSHTRSR